MSTIDINIINQIQARLNNLRNCFQSRDKTKMSKRPLNSHVSSSLNPYPYGSYYTKSRYFTPGRNNASTFPFVTPLTYNNNNTNTSGNNNATPSTTVGNNNFIPTTTHPYYNNPFYSGMGNASSNNTPNITPDPRRNGTNNANTPSTPTADGFPTSNTNAGNNLIPPYTAPMSNPNNFFTPYRGNRTDNATNTNLPPVDPTSLDPFAPAITSNNN